MVKLDLRSPYDRKQYPFLHKWDTDYRENFDQYQDEIDRITYQLQRSQRGFAFMGQWLYPYFHQRDLLLLDLYKKKQTIGKINKDEIEIYRDINPRISSDLDKTFSTNFYIPKAGAFAGLGLNVFAHMFNFSYPYRLTLFIVPVAADYLIRFLDTSARHNSIQFLDWLISYRTARARLEFDSHKFQDVQGQIFQRFRHITKVTKPVNAVYDQLVNIVAAQRPEEI